MIQTTYEVTCKFPRTKKIWAIRVRWQPRIKLVHSIQWENPSLVEEKQLYVMQTYEEYSDILMNFPELLSKIK